MPCCAAPCVPVAIASAKCRASSTPPRAWRMPVTDQKTSRSATTVLGPCSRFSPLPVHARAGARRREVAGPVHARAKEEEANATGVNEEQGTAAGEGGGDSSDEKPLGEVILEIATSPLFYVTAGAGVAYKIVSLNEQTSTVVLLASLPFIVVYYIGNYSPLGQALESGLKERLPQLEAAADARRADQAVARDESQWYGAGRPRWLGPLSGGEGKGAGGGAPHLRGELAGDYGFDPLGLAAEPGKLEKYQELELLHARWAMLAALGALVPEALAMGGAAIPEPVWWKVGAARLAGGDINYLGVQGLRVAGGQGALVIALCQVVLMGGPEAARYVGIRGLEPLGVFLPGDQNYPGGTVFDPLDLGKDARYLEEQKVKEIKNGRLAMVSVLGFYVQAAVTRKGPLENLLDFLGDPAGENAAANLSKALGG